MTLSKDNDSKADKQLQSQVSAVLSLLRPAIQGDGGDVELVGVREDGVVMVRLLGACVGCPSSEVTLTQGIEQNLKNQIPQITGVECV